MTKWQCKQKKQYSTREEASGEIYRIMTESAGGAIDLRYYRCKYCKKFHLTSTIK